MKNKAVQFIINNWVSWVIEISILGVIATFTISEVQKTNEQTRQMLTAVSNFASARQEGVGKAIDSIADEAREIEIDGEINLDTFTLESFRNLLKDIEPNESED